MICPHRLWKKTLLRIGVSLAFVLAFILVIRSRGPAVTIQSSLQLNSPPVLVKCQSKLSPYLWNKTVSQDIKIPATYNCFNSDSAATQSRLSVREVLDSKNFDGITDCEKRVPKYSETPLPRTALASLPGSGSTWCRHLIEQFSGIYTGSVYCGVTSVDFEAECEHDMWPYTIVIKTNHRPYKMGFDRAVLILRDPYKAIFAEYNRLQLGKRETVGPEAFQDPSWIEAVAKYTSNWRQRNGDWLKDFKKPMHVVVYERLLSDFYEEMYKLASFLNVTLTYGDLWCLKENGEGNWHRKHVLEPVYTVEQRKNIDRAITEITELVKERFQINLPY